MVYVFFWYLFGSNLNKSYRVSWMHGLGMSPSAWENGTGSFRLVQSTKQTHRIHPCSFHLLFVFCLQQDIRWLLVLCLDAFPDIWPDLACIFSSFCRVPAGLDITHRLYGVLRSSDFVLLDANTKMVVWGKTFISGWGSYRKWQGAQGRHDWRGRSHAIWAT